MEPLKIHSRGCFERVRHLLREKKKKIRSAYWPPDSSTSLCTVLNSVFLISVQTSIHCVPVSWSDKSLTESIGEFLFLAANTCAILA